MIILETRLVFREMVTHKAQGGLLVVTGIRDLEGACRARLHQPVRRRCPAKR
jgi:hypothetical protein